jgi:diaminopimelate decarboxylase
MQEYIYKGSDLWCEGVRLREVADACGTPLYVYSKQSIVDHCRHIERAFGTIDHLSCYAVKANSTPGVLRTIAGQGLGADVGSVGELQFALDAGFLPEKVTFSGVGKRDDEIERALTYSIHSFNVESEEELDVLNEIASRNRARARILLRLNFDIEASTHPYVTTGRKHSKFGVESSKARDILSVAQCLPGIEVLGIHSHLGSQITDAETFRHAARMILATVNDLRAAGIAIRQLNFGGGFGVQYRDYVAHPELPSDGGHQEHELTTVKLLESILPILAESRCTILIQPGRSIVAHAGVLLTKVLYRKVTSERTFVIVDAGMNDLIRPSLYQSYHQIVPLALHNAPHEMVDVVGPLCETGDFLAMDRPLPRVERGDYCAIMCTGAYGSVLASNYNGRPRPAEAMVDGDRFEITVPREQFRH